MSSSCTEYFPFRNIIHSQIHFSSRRTAQFPLSCLILFNIRNQEQTGCVDNNTPMYIAYEMLHLRCVLSTVQNVRYKLCVLGQHSAVANSYKIAFVCHVVWKADSIVLSLAALHVWLSRIAIQLWVDAVEGGITSTTWLVLLEYIFPEWLLQQIKTSHCGP